MKDKNPNEGAPGAEGTPPAGAVNGAEETVLANLRRENAELRETVERAGAEINRLQAEVNQLRRQDGVPQELEELVKEKLAAGLPREQAIEVARAQIAWDREQEKAAKKK